MKNYLWSLVFVLFPSALFGQVMLAEGFGGEDTFPLVTSAAKGSGLYYSERDFEVVKKTLRLLAEDIKRVTGYTPAVSSEKVKTECAVITGTIGYSPIIDKLVKDNKLDVSAIRNGWEQYVVKTLDSPMRGVKKALVIAGSDRRGTAYGILSLSEAIGVSPLYWWADVPVKKRSSLFIKSVNYTSKTPSVRYRGIFINDEGWGFGPWAKKTFDKELGAIGPKTYAKVCELILRMKGNMLAPAMHPSSAAFNKYPENKLVADSFGIVMSSSHCEPLLFNNVTEWHKKTMGEWNYQTNSKGIYRELGKRVAQSSPYENVYTIAVRGLHDTGMHGIPPEREVGLTEEGISGQRSILSRYIKRPIDSIPQIYVPYKEALDVYERGVKLPEDITLVWPDDNFGYFKRLSYGDERKRKGGSGVYYHISYLGEPHGYLWLNTTPPALMYAELSKAYETGANRYWLLNVGDIKPGELGMKTFLDMAWDIDAFNFENINNNQPEFLTSVFGEHYRKDLADIMNSYYQLAFQRKPEHMGWGQVWNYDYVKERIADTDFSFTNYREAEDRMCEYERIVEKSRKIWEALPESYKPAYFELVHYPVKGSALTNKKFLTAQRNRWYARQGRAATNLVAKEAQACHDSIQYYSNLYNSLLNGKWNHMMRQAPEWEATYHKMAPTDTISLPQKSEMAIFIPGQDCTYGTSNSMIYVLPCLNSFAKEETFIELYNRGTEAFSWKAETDQPWIKLSRKKGKIDLQDRILVSVDWSKLPDGENHKGEIRITANNGHTETVYLPVFHPSDELKGMYVESNGVVSINAGKFQRKVENDNIKITAIEGLGWENSAVRLGNALLSKPVHRRAAYENMGDPALAAQNLWHLKESPRAEYDFYTFNAGAVTIHVYALPTFPLSPGLSNRFAVMLDNGLLKSGSNDAKEFSSEWRENVLRNSTIVSFTMNLGKPGRHTLKLFCEDPGVVVQKIVIDLGGMKRSCLGPKVTWIE